MLTISLEILNSNKYLLEKYREKYVYIQLDEGQDTSKIQMEIIRLLASPKNNLFIVADDDQSIYGFRGAYPQGLFDFKKDYPNGKFFYMEDNFRSTKNIVSLSNKFIKKNKSRYNKEITTENGYLEPINIIKVKNINEQYKYILRDLNEKGIKNTAILFRNNLSSIGLMEIFEKNKIPFKIRDTKLRFFNHWLVNEILNLMKFAEDTSQMEIFESLYYKIKGYISKKQINYAKTLDYNTSVFDRIMEYPGISEFYKKNLRELKLDFKKVSKLKPNEAIKYIEDTLEYGEYLRENSKKYGMTYDTLKTMLFYLELISKGTNNLPEFIGRLNHLQYLSSNSKTANDAVVLSTVHSAKG
jgi:DNA helicase-2/ATP-dependent DNA helicase PcrA